MMYYIEKDNNIKLANEDKQIILNTLICRPELKDLPILETEKNIVYFIDKFYFEDDEEYTERKAQAERERIAELSMTRSDFFDGMIMAFGLDSRELRVMIENILNSINITPVEIKVALNNYDNALNFYRKHTLFTLLNNVPIEIGEYTLIFTSGIWDKFFDTKDYRELQKAIQIEPEPVDDDSDSDTDTDDEIAEQVRNDEVDSEVDND